MLLKGFFDISFVVFHSGECVCTDCFMINDTTGRCRICSDYAYSNISRACGVDHRPSQLTAFLLSFFLSSTGAANFYIGRSSLGTYNYYTIILMGRYFFRAGT